MWDAKRWKKIGSSNRMHHQQWCRAVKSRLSYKNATIAVCVCNVIAAVLLLQGVFCPSSSKFVASDKALQGHIRESEDIRRSMLPVDLIRRVREIEQEAYVEDEQIQNKDVKQTAAVDLISRLNNFHLNSDGGTKALEEWRKRKMERARQRLLVKNGTSGYQS